MTAVVMEGPMILKIEPHTPPMTLRQWSRTIGIPYGLLRAAVRENTLTYYRFTTKGPQYVTAEDMQDFLDRSRRGRAVEEVEQ
jgi:hypothetical protein